MSWDNPVVIAALITLLGVLFNASMILYTGRRDGAAKHEEAAAKREEAAQKAHAEARAAYEDAKGYHVEMINGLQARAQAQDARIVVLETENAAQALEIGGLKVAVAACLEREEEQAPLLRWLKREVERLGGGLP